MKLRLALGLWLGTVLLSATGCGWWNSDEPPEADELLPDLRFAAEEPADDSEQAVSQLVPKGLQPGERFGFRKTVEQTLTQEFTPGPVVSRTQLELWFDLSVLAVAADRTELAVLYKDVRYQQELPGRRVEFDSRAPSPELPAEARLYRGLVHNGFSFSVPSNGEAIELSNVDEFVERCLQHLPSEQREPMRQYLTETWTPNMAADLVQETVKLIPVDVELAPGATTAQLGRQWTRQRVESQPLPMTLSTTATLEELKEQTAEVALAGRIASSAEVVPAAAQSSTLRMTLRGGQCSGRYTVDRRTRLPIQAHLERTLDMLVETAGGEAFEQQKRTVITIRTATDEIATAEATPQTGTPRPVRPAVRFDASNHTLRSMSELQRR